VHVRCHTLAYVTDCGVWCLKCWTVASCFASGPHAHHDPMLNGPYFAYMHMQIMYPLFILLLYMCCSRLPIGTCVSSKTSPATWQRSLRKSLSTSALPPVALPLRLHLLGLRSLNLHLLPDPLLVVILLHLLPDPVLGMWCLPVLLPVVLLLKLRTTCGRTGGLATILLSPPEWHLQHLQRLQPRPLVVLSRSRTLRMAGRMEGWSSLR
jgi:hypothetical protein